jgi:hypothetical protein
MLFSQIRVPAAVEAGYRDRDIPCFLAAIDRIIFFSDLH